MASLTGKTSSGDSAWNVYVKNTLFPDYACCKAFNRIGVGESFKIISPDYKISKINGRNRRVAITDKGEIPLSCIHKPSGKTVDVQERQEIGLIRAINTYAHTLEGGIRIEGLQSPVLTSYKVSARTPEGKEPLTDIVLQHEFGNFNISCKGNSAPSFAGGGMPSLLKLVPEFITTSFKKILDFSVEMEFEEGDYSVRDFYVPIQKDVLLTIFKGTENISHLYVGPMEVEHEIKEGELFFNGKFNDVNEYIKKYNWWMRVRRRDGTQFFTYQSSDCYGFKLPMIFSNGSAMRSRVVISNHLPKNNNEVI